MRKLFTGILLFSFTGSFAQTKESSKDESWKQVRHATAIKINRKIDLQTIQEPTSPFGLIGKTGGMIVCSLTNYFILIRI